MSATLTWALIAAVCSPVALPAQTESKKLSARELYFAAVRRPAEPPKTEEPKPPAKPPEKLPAAKKAPAKKTPAAKPAVPPAGDSGAKVQSIAAVAATPLGLRYSILKKFGDEMREVGPNTVFHAGDRIQIAVEASESGYLYIVHQGSSGAWRPIFPSAEIEGGSNRIEAGRKYVMPPKRLYFDEQAGIEKMFLVLSRTPEPDLEKMIYSLRDTAAPVTPQRKEPTLPRPTPPMVAQNFGSVDDATVGRLRIAYARDLLVEEVDEDTPAQKDKAVYVVNPPGAASTRVVADIRLDHR